MKKTLIITMEFPPQIGGIATYVDQFASALEPEKVVVLAPLYKDKKIVENFDKQRKYKIIRKKLLFPKFIWPRWLKLYFQVRKIVKEEKIEIILINHVLPVGYIGTLIKRFLKVPFLILSHGTDVIYATRNKWKTNRLKKVILQAEQVVFNSESLMRRFLIKLPEFSTKSIVVYPCPDADFLIPPPKQETDFLREKLALQGKKVILTVARMEDGKGFPHLVRTLPKILQKEPHVVWLIVGDGPKKEQVMKDIQKHSLQNVVRYIGQVPHNEIKKYYYLADLFVLFTHPDEGREEGLGLVFLEAESCGLPVLAGKSGGVEEAVLHTQTGIVIDIRQNAMAMDETVVEMLKNEEYSKSLAKNALDRIKTEFIWERQLSKLKQWLV
ncbi:MAG: glycosyltransferase family 4 protein [Patescibacteria group bacterium]|nr:glycosyltransferase family 4 protein [Patescibacteria group bacterium]